MPGTTLNTSGVTRSEVLGLGALGLLPMRPKRRGRKIATNRFQRVATFNNSLAPAGEIINHYVTFGGPPVGYDWYIEACAVIFLSADRTVVPWANEAAGSALPNSATIGYANTDGKPPGKPDGFQVLAAVYDFPSATSFDIPRPLLVSDGMRLIGNCAILRNDTGLNLDASPSFNAQIVQVPA